MPGGQGNSQPTISAFFQPPGKKRQAASPIDLTVDSEDGAPRVKSKRAKISTPSSPRTPVATSKTLASAAEQWRFTPSSPEKTEPSVADPSRTEAEVAAQNQRREAFKRKLLLENSRFILKNPSVPTTECIPVDSPPEVNTNREVGEESEDESDHTFKELSDMFSHRGKGKSTERSVSKRARKVLEVGPSGQSYTPLELQVLRLKEDNPGTLLMVEVGYRYKFFGDDAKVAAKELGMVAYNDRNFLLASIPIHRRDVHLKKLLSQGYRVGIVNQVETAALKKAGDNRNAPFDRKLMHLYTAATYVDDLDSVDDLERYTPPPFMCLVEEKKTGSIADVSVGMIVICPSTGDVVWDDFEDGLMRIELETRLVHTRPTELLLPRDGLSDLTAKMLSHFTDATPRGHRIRTETFDKVMSYGDAFSLVSNFYTDKKKLAAASEGFKSGKLMAAVTEFPKRVVIALGHAIKHLLAFGIADAFLETEFFSKFTTKTHMLLAANTLTNLEIYRNDTDYTTRGSLIWILDHTKTKFGARLLKSWVGRPLVDRCVLQDRVDAVEEMLSSTSENLVTLRQILKKLPDLAKGLCRIQYGQCTPQELAVLLPAFKKVATAYQPVETPADVGFNSSILNDTIFSFPKLMQPMKELMGAISMKYAAQGRKDRLWTDPERYPAIADADLSIQSVEVELMEELKSIRKTLRMPSLQWATVAGEEYLVEVRRSENRPIPSSWIRVSRTKYFERFQPPVVKRKLEERAQYQETLQAEGNKAFSLFLEEIAQKYYGVLRDAVNKLATADCLLSFALVALQDNYVRPQFTDDDTFEIVDGRHPMVEALRSDPFVPNSIKMGGGKPRSKVITGPNMGGKSSSVRMIALIAIMAQIGSYVPAASVKLGLLDSILTRMGASDDLARGRSTFMVEMSETSDILHLATQNSLVILDELGRGTSTFDGMAVADAVMHQLVETTKCKALFITHYPLIAAGLEKSFPYGVENLHMGYEAESRIDGSREITFLYRLTSGIASESFGIECGRLAGLPDTLLAAASRAAADMRRGVEHRMRQNRIRKGAQLLQRCLNGTGIGALGALEELRTIVQPLFTSTDD